MTENSKLEWLSHKYGRDQATSAPIEDLSDLSIEEIEDLFK